MKRLYTIKIPLHTTVYGDMAHKNSPFEIGRGLALNEQRKFSLTQDFYFTQKKNINKLQIQRSMRRYCAMESCTNHKNINHCFVQTVQENFRTWIWYHAPRLRMICSLETKFLSYKEKPSKIIQKHCRKNTRISLQELTQNA